ncbi:MAG: signal peptidase I [Gammaproteobacteria bacterium]|nr:signal peptidase I [Gammaproteobacteria bacterium]
MNLDFQALMALVLLVTGVIWGLDAWLWAPRRRAAAAALQQQQLGEDVVQKAIRVPVYVEWSRSFFPIILVVLALRSFVVEPFRIPSASMMPSLLVGDFILVNKYAYGLRLPVTETRILETGEPQRGDVIVFRYPENPSLDYIKRVVGLPGDRISYYNRVLYVNGEPMPQQVIGEYVGIGAGANATGWSHRRENLGGVEHQILLRPGRSMLEGDYIVPEGNYFVMGDNRDNSNDSRVWGTVPEANLVGRAFMIWMNWDAAGGGVDWGRLGTMIH